MGLVSQTDNEPFPEDLLVNKRTFSPIYTTSVNKHKLSGRKIMNRLGQGEPTLC